MQFIDAKVSTMLAILTLLLALSCTAAGQSLYSDHPSRSTILAAAKRGAASNEARRHSDLSKHTQQLRARGSTDVPLPSPDVLGYVTPWNPAGYRVAEEYRAKLTSVSPVWYTVDTKGDDYQRYRAMGGPPSSVEVEWYQRLAQPAGQLPAVKVLPRFNLESSEWTSDDFRTLLSHTIEGMGFAEAIVAEVMVRGYDGVVLETGAAWALREPIRLLADRLHQEDKELIVVFPPLREDTQEANNIILQGVSGLADIADGIHVMTYDHLGPNGAAFEPPASLEEDSILRKDGVRTWGANTPLEWIERNVEGFNSPLESADFADAGFASSSTSSSLLSKLLVGVACYGYTYPVGWVDSNGKAQLVTPPTSPIASKDNSSDAQAASRAKAVEREGKRGLYPVMPAIGSPFTFSDLVDVLLNNKALVRRDEGSAENFIDYVKAREDGKTQVRPDGTEAPLAWYRRAVFPSPATIEARLKVTEESGAGGVALWDIGQGGDWLLDVL